MFQEYTYEFTVNSLTKCIVFNGKPAWKGILALREFTQKVTYSYSVVWHAEFRYITIYDCMFNVLHIDWVCICVERKKNVFSDEMAELSFEEK